MKRILLALLLPVVPGCLIDNDLAEDPDEVSAETRVSNQAGDWCEAACERATDCGVNEAGDDCVESCRGYFTTTFVGHGETCAEFGLQQMDCFDTSSCTELNDGLACELDADAEVACEPDDSGAPTPGGPVSCNEYGMQGIAPGATTFQCGTEASDCADGHVYTSECWEPQPGVGECTCAIDGLQTSWFGLSELVCPTEEEVYSGCNFPLGDNSAPQMGPSPSVCEYGSGGGGPADGSFGCSSEFGCNGDIYAVVCAERNGEDLCTCYLNGEPGATFGVFDGVCPGNGMPEDFATINDGCGWNITL